MGEIKTYGYFMNIGALSQLVRAEQSKMKSVEELIINKLNGGLLQAWKHLSINFVSDCNRLSVRAVDATVWHRINTKKIYSNM